MLSIRGLVAGYGGGRVLHGIDLDVPAGTVTTVIGPNGAGKTTLVHAIVGLVPPASGTVSFAGTVLSGRPAHRIARSGVALVPQGRRVFPSLTVAEHLRLVGGDVAAVVDLFPALRRRLRHRGDQLSGGEQQMLAIARALLRAPRLLVLDEPCEGLAGDVAGRVRALVRELARAGTTVLLVEQGHDATVALADQIAVLDHGRLVDSVLIPVSAPEWEGVAAR